MNGTDPRKAVIVGPCSIHDKKSAIEYAKRFKELSEKVGRSLFLVMRVYFEKSRTFTGWKGLLYDPHLDGSHDLQAGLLLDAGTALDAGRDGKCPWRQNLSIL